MKIKSTQCYMAAVIYFAMVGASQSAPGVLGDGRGVDHVGVAVRDLSQARQDFERLGFNISPEGNLPGGLKNCGALFGNRTYIELVSVAPQPTSPDAIEVKKFAEQHEGAMFAGFNISSAKDTYTFLKFRNFDVTDPTPSELPKEGETTPPPPVFFTVGFADKPARGMVPVTLPIFFIEYLNSESQAPKIFTDAAIRHSNAALGIHAIWFAVRDSHVSLRLLNNVGFTQNGKTAKLFDVQADEITAGRGVLILLSSNDKQTEPAQYLANHDDGIMAVSVHVSSLKTAKRKVESVLHTRLEIYNGTFGKSFLIPASSAHGLWIEMFEQ